MSSLRYKEVRGGVGWGGCEESRIDSLNELNFLAELDPHIDE